jgi:hypothetical protein
MIEKLSTAAKLTQKMYGIRRKLASGDTLWNVTMVNSIATQRILIMINPNNGDLYPKNAADHDILSISWTIKMMNAILTCVLPRPLRQMRNNAIPMSANNAIQTGAKSQLGGVNDGFLMVAYQVGIEGVVKNEPSIPAPWQINILTMNLTISIGFMKIAPFTRRYIFLMVHTSC